MIVGLENRNDVLPLYIGNDRTYEYAFEVSTSNSSTNSSEDSGINNRNDRWEKPNSSMDIGN